EVGSYGVSGAEVLHVRYPFMQQSERGDAANWTVRQSLEVKLAVAPVVGEQELLRPISLERADRLEGIDFAGPESGAVSHNEPVVRSNRSEEHTSELQ